MTSEPEPYRAEAEQKGREKTQPTGSLGLADRLHMSRKTIQSWEQGTRQPQQASARLLQFIEQPHLLADAGRRE